MSDPLHLDRLGECYVFHARIRVPTIKTRLMSIELRFQHYDRTKYVIFAHDVLAKGEQLNPDQSAK